MNHLTIFCLLLAGTTAFKKCITDPGSVPICGTRRCQEETFKCEDEKCVCRVGYGQNELICTEQDHFASIINDPRAFTIDKRQGAHLPLPCMYLYSHIQTKLNSYLSPNGVCDIKVFPFNTRVNGKIYVGGFEVVVDVINLGSQPNLTMVYKVNGSGEDGKYCYTAQISKDGDIYETEELDTNKQVMVEGSPFTFDVHEPDHMFRLILPICGIYVYYRAPDSTLSTLDQKWLPGLAMKVDNDNNPSFLSRDTVVALTPGQTLPFSDGKLTDAFIARALQGEGNDKTDFPNASGKCQAAASAFSGCEDPEVALESCRPFLLTPPFVDCYSKPDGPGGVDKIMTLYSECIRSFCTQQYHLCDEIHNTLNALNMECRNKAPNHDCNKIPSSGEK